MNKFKCINCYHLHMSCDVSSTLPEMRTKKIDSRDEEKYKRNKPIKIEGEKVRSVSYFVLNIFNIYDKNNHTIVR